MEEKPKRGRGQPRKLQKPAVCAEFLRVLKEGCSLHDAANWVGISYQTVCTERNRDSKFNNAVQRAELESKRACIKQVKKKKPEFLLERKWWKEFGRRSPDQIGIAQVLAIVCPAFTEVIQKVPPEDRQWCLDRIELLIEKLRLGSKGK